MAVVKTHIIHQQYRDSVQLMRASSVASKLEGIRIASVLMGTPKNKPLLEEVGLLTSEAMDAGANDIIISIKASTEVFANEAIKFIIEYMNQQEIDKEDTLKTYRSIRGAITGIPEANLTVISVPGEYAARETRLALEQNLNVMLFSDNVSLEDEIALKKYAHEKGLIVMGPDCGTAMIKNIGLGFANVVSPGPIGIVAASGTGTQEVMVLCHRIGVGVTHAIGTGSRDVKEAIGGISMIDGLNALDRDENVELILIISKPPDEKILRRVLDEVKRCQKPIIINFLGKKAGYCDLTRKILTVDTLEEVAYSASHFIQSNELKRVSVTFEDKEHVKKILYETRSILVPEQKYIRGLFAGGTFTFEAAMIISNILPSTDNLWTNVKLESTNLIDNPFRSKEHTLIDMGSDEFTVGKPHPMIDQTERTRRFLEEINDPQTAVILMDFILGWGSHEDPVIDMRKAFSQWNSLNRKIPIVSHICGTELDPQDLNKSISELTANGVYIMPTNAQAARLAALIAIRNEGTKGVY
ncbi:MAG: acyl-CoA synthetase FdrA [Candidatus Heimdallarchaeota archaeon]|nr:MAG: acyl-CoA synthetase FdrA [Candidatus Heimdallarchaeota archaeon]